MKTFISSEDFQRVLELLGLPGETLHIEIGSRERWVLTGVDSTWAMKAIIAEPGSYDERHRNLEPYTERVVYTPVLLPNDWKGQLATAEPNTWVAVPDYVFEEVLVDRFGSIEAAERHYGVKITNGDAPLPATSQPSLVPPVSPFAAANPGTGAYGDGPYITPDERKYISLAPSLSSETSSE